MPVITSLVAYPKGIALVVEKAADRWGKPNGYILGEEPGGAFISGLRYGNGTLYTKNGGDLRFFGKGQQSALM